MYMLALLALLPVSILIHGFVLHKLWAWFIVTAFGAPALGIAAAIGVSLVVGIMTHQRRNVDVDSGDAAASEAISIVVGPLLILGIGYVVKSFL